MSTPQSPTCRKKVTVHVTFLKIGEINTLKEQFNSDVLLRSRWREPLLDLGQGDEKTNVVDWTKYWDPQLYIENTVGEPKRTFSKALEYDEVGHAWVTERRRVKGTFMEQMELFEFPFDVQDLTVTIMSERVDAEIDLQEAEEIHKIYKQSFIDEQEWYLFKYVESERLQKLRDLADPTDKRTVVHVKARAARRAGYFVFNMFLITFLIVCLAFATFAVPTALIQNRLQLAFTLVLTCVAFKFVVNQSLPRISYLTYLDRYVLATMIMLALTCFWHALQTLIDSATYPQKDHVALGVIASSYVIYNGLFLLRLWRIPYRKRRGMKKKEREYISSVKEQSLTKCNKSRREDSVLIRKEGVVSRLPSSGDINNSNSGATSPDKSSSPKAVHVVLTATGRQALTGGAPQCDV